MLTLTIDVYIFLIYTNALIQVRKFENELAKANICKHPESWDEHGLAGADWLDGLLKRHPNLSLRQPRAYLRATSFNKTNVSKFFSNLVKVIQKTPFHCQGYLEYG